MNIQNVAGTFSVLCISSVLIASPSNAATPEAQSMLKAAAETFCVTPKAGNEGESLTHAKVDEVFSPLKTTLTLVKDEHAFVCLITTHFMIEHHCLSTLIRRRVADKLDIPPEQVFVFSSHNHTDVALTTDPMQYGIPKPDARIPESQLTAEGHALLDGLLEAAIGARNRTAPVRVAWNVGHDRRITYNRKGCRPDGSTYFMREEDRLLLGEDFAGDIDDDAPVIAFLGLDDKPVCFLVQFAGHPTTVYDPEHPVVHGDYPQVACDDLSEAFGGVPVGFLQGCAANLNSKGLLTQSPSRKSAPRRSSTDTGLAAPTLRPRDIFGPRLPRMWLSRGSGYACHSRRCRRRPLCKGNLPR